MTVTEELRELSKMRRRAYIRVCQDSNYQLEFSKAAFLAAEILGCCGIDIWCAFSDIKLMQQIASGEKR